MQIKNKSRIFHECSCFIEFIKRVLGKVIKCEACHAFYHFLTTSLMLDFIYHMVLKYIL